MALLAMYKDVCEPAVAHINYHHRDSADRDEGIVRDFCEKYDIPFYKADYVSEDENNFQADARSFRYRFFTRLIKEMKLDGLMIAHHLDDFLETYIMQKEKGAGVFWYGLRSLYRRDGITIYRPLLGCEKKELVAYCDENAVPYGIDESNLDDDYRRNQIRHQIIEKMNRVQKLKLYEEIMELNHSLIRKRMKARSFIGGRKSIAIRELMELDNDLLAEVLRQMIAYDLSKDHIDEIVRQIRESDGFVMKWNNHAIVSEYGSFGVYEDEEDYEYTLTYDDWMSAKDVPGFHEFTCFSDKHFMICSEGSSFEGVSLSVSDFPLTIRNYREGDKIAMLYGHKKLSRFFKDSKISYIERKSYPVLLSADGRIILVPGIGCDRDHYSIKHDMFMIKLKNQER